MKEGAKMSKRIVNVMMLVLICLILTGLGSFALTKKFTVSVLTKEKTVLANNQEVVGLIDFKYYVKKNVTIATEESGVYLSYRGTLITGAIKAKLASAILDGALKSGANLNIDYLHAKNKKVTKYSFSSCKVEGEDVKKKGGKVVEVTYTFQAMGMAETKEN